MRVEGVKRIIQYRSRGWIEIKNREQKFHTFGDVIFYAALGIIATCIRFSLSWEAKELSNPLAIPTLIPCPAKQGLHVPHGPLTPSISPVAIGKLAKTASRKVRLQSTNLPSAFQIGT